MSTLEIEVKLEVSDVAGVPARMAELGARLLHPREFEDNELYDFPDRSLMGRGSMLRVRRVARQTLLTYKDRPRTEAGMKIREEVETHLEASQAAPLAETFRRMGMVVIFRYQKYRTTWSMDEILVTLDETPIGAYFELEGGRDGIDTLATRLGYSAADYLPLSYRDLYTGWLARNQGPTDRMIFPDRHQAQG